MSWSAPLGAGPQSAVGIPEEELLPSAAVVAYGAACGFGLGIVLKHSILGASAGALLGALVIYASAKQRGVLSA